MADEVVVEEAVLSDMHVGTDKGAAYESSAFECNICYELAQSPVVTPCGHLYCWPCLYRFVWLPMVAPAMSLLWHPAHESSGVGRVCQESVTVCCTCRWMQVQTQCQSCPVCKAGIVQEKVGASPAQSPAGSCRLLFLDRLQRDLLRRLRHALRRLTPL
jgi:E3 ubiquitin-protein ligase RNF5